MTYIKIAFFCFLFLCNTFIYSENVNIWLQANFPNDKNLVQLAERADFCNVIDSEKFHMTLLYLTIEVEKSKLQETAKKIQNFLDKKAKSQFCKTKFLKLKYDSLDLFGSNKDHLVAKFKDNKYLNTFRSKIINEILKKYPNTQISAPFVPHITLKLRGQHQQLDETELKVSNFNSDKKNLIFDAIKLSTKSILEVKKRTPSLSFE